MTAKLLLATRNRHKETELRSLLAGLPVELLTLADFPHLAEAPEDQPTFLGNATQKALWGLKQTGIPTLADDSGLEVAALGGLPGVHSARFAGEKRDDLQNNLKLLSLLKDIPPERRTARFVCVIVLAAGDGKIYSAQGRCQGLIIEEFCGTGGFGYDPIFYVPGRKKTFAQLTLAEKNRISHRGKALRKAVRIIEKVFPA